MPRLPKWGRVGGLVGGLVGWLVSSWIGWLAVGGFSDIEALPNISCSDLSVSVAVHRRNLDLVRAAARKSQRAELELTC